MLIDKTSSARFQSFVLSCLNKRIDGYQGLSLLSSNQRQSGAKGNSTQVGLFRAPAKCAVLVSTLMMTSINSHNAAVSEKSCRA